MTDPIVDRMHQQTVGWFSEPKLKFPKYIEKLGEISYARNLII